VLLWKRGERSRSKERKTQSERLGNHVAQQEEREKVKGKKPGGMAAGPPEK